MAIDPPYRLDPWQNIVNVHWPRHPDGVGTVYMEGQAAAAVAIATGWFNGPAGLADGDFYQAEPPWTRSNVRSASVSLELDGYTNFGGAWQLPGIGGVYFVTGPAPGTILADDIVANDTNDIGVTFGGCSVDFSGSSVSVNAGGGALSNYWKASSPVNYPFVEIIQGLPGSPNPLAAGSCNFGSMSITSRDSGRTYPFSRLTVTSTDGDNYLSAGALFRIEFDVS